MIAIHIGASKAGSTTIQKFLGGNVEALRQIGVDYPRIGLAGRGSHVNLYYDVRGHRNFKPRFGTLSQLISSLKSEKYDLTILSAEEFQRCKPPEVAIIKDKLLDVDNNIQIILIIRDLVELMPSAYSQSTKVGENVLDFDSFFLKRVHGYGKAFVGTARVWGDAFGWDRLSVRILDRRLLLNGDLIDDFLASVGVDTKGCDFQRSDKIDVANASPGWRVLEAVRALFGGGHGLQPEHPLANCGANERDERKLIGRIARQLGEDLGWNADRGRYLSRDQAQHCIEIHSEAITSLNVFLAEDLPQPIDLTRRGFVAREFMPEASQIPAQELRAFYDELAVRASQKRRAAASA